MDHLAITRMEMHRAFSWAQSKKEEIQLPQFSILRFHAINGGYD